MNKRKINVWEQINAQKGITLIALVITIIVMLILVGVTINLSLNGGLFGYAKQAVKETEKVRDQELQLADGLINGQTIDEIVNGSSAYTAYQKAEKNADGTLKENITYTEGEKTAVIPKGFAVSKVTGEQTIEEGLVITDKVDSEGNSIGNEFVWIPVTDGELNRTEWKNNEPTETISSIYTETLPEEIINSVKQCKGFYIGRYEAGTDEARNNKSGTTDMVVQKGAYPYNYVCWGKTMTDTDSEYTWTSGSNTYNIGHGAVYLSENMYTDSETYGVKSILPYGAMWDETLKFIKDKVNVTNSTSWGNYNNNTFTFSGRYSSDYGTTWSGIVTNQTKATDPAWLLTTGASEKNKAKNIYDLAGNVQEWTMEACGTS